MLTNAGEVMLELNLSQLQCHPDAHDAAPASCYICSCYSNATTNCLVLPVAHHENSHCGLMFIHIHQTMVSNFQTYHI